MTFATVVKISLVVLLIAFAAEAARGKKKQRVKKNTGACKVGEDSDVAKNISLLWAHIKYLSQPIQVHVHGEEGHHDSHHHIHHGHNDTEHEGHAHGGHAHNDTKHEGHAHGGHAHDDYHHSSGHNHIHIHLSVNDKEKECGSIRHVPEDVFVYVRCDIVPEGSNTINGSILMRQKPNESLQAKIRMDKVLFRNKFAEGFYYNLHSSPDFSNGCASFGPGMDGSHKHGQGHDHEGHDHGDHENHKHGDHKSHKHGDHKSHKHGGHKSHKHGDHKSHKHGDHKSHKHGDHKSHEHDHHKSHMSNADNQSQAVYGWGQLVTNHRGVVKMEASCNHHELYGPSSILGRGIVVHAKDSSVLGCCGVTYASLDDEAWDKLKF